MAAKKFAIGDRVRVRRGVGFKGHTGTIIGRGRAPLSFVRVWHVQMDQIAFGRNLAKLTDRQLEPMPPAQDPRDL